MLKKVFAFILVTGLLAGALLLLADYKGSEVEKRPRPKPRPAVKRVYDDFATFSGQTPGKTETFHIDRGPWRLRWEIGGLPKSASAGFTVFSDNAAVPLIYEENGLRSPSKGTITIEKTGGFYILVSSYEANWRLTVERLN